MAKNERADMAVEEYLKGRRAGVEGTYGDKRKGVAEKTIVPGKANSDGGGEDGLAAKVKSLYGRAVAASEDPSKIGDQALRDR